MVKVYQCDLISGNSKTRSYIPEKGAVVGKKVNLKDSDNPDIVWIVESVANIGIDEKYLSELQTAYRKQREASDI